MSAYSNYQLEILKRKEFGLSPKPIESFEILNEIIKDIKRNSSNTRKESLNHLIFNTLPGTTPAAKVKAEFLKDIILNLENIEEISIDFAFELLSHMKGGASVRVLLDIAFSNNKILAKKASQVLKTQVFLYDEDTNRLNIEYQKGNKIAKDILVSYCKAEFFTRLPALPKKIDVVTYVVGVGDISTDLLSPGNQAHSRSDRELHGQCFVSKKAQNEIKELQYLHPDKRVMLVAEKGTMGVGSSRMSGVNNVALWTGIPSSKYIPFVNIAPIVAGTNGISPIFLTTVSVTGGIGIDLKNWGKKLDKDGEPIIDENGDFVLQQTFSVETGTHLVIDTEKKKLFSGKKELIDISSSLSPQKIEFIRAGGSYAVVFGKKLQSFAANVLSVEPAPVFAKSKIITNNKFGQTAVEKIFNLNKIGNYQNLILKSGSDVRVKVNIVGSQDTTGLMTSQELEAMAATKISPKIDGAYQSGCHTASVWDKKAQENTPKLMKFMQNFGLITGRDPENKYAPLTDVIHKVLNDITVDDWSIIIGGDSHTRMSKGVAFGADSGTVALALATGEANMPIPESVKVTFKGNMADHLDFRDIVHATHAQMLDKYGDNIFQGRVIEVHIGTLLADQAFTFTDWTAEMKAKASICISNNDILAKSLEISISRIKKMISKGMDNDAKMLHKLIKLAKNRIDEIHSGKKCALTPDENAQYFERLTIDLDEIDEPMIADPDVNNIDISKRYTHDTIRPLSYYEEEKKVDLGFVGSCMVHKGDIKIVAHMLKNLEKATGDVRFKTPLVIAPPTYNIVEELKAEGDWEILQKYSGFEFDDLKPKKLAREKYENILYLERPGCNLCMGNQEKAAKGATVMATSTRLFKGRVVEDSEEKKGESLLSSTPVVVLSTILGRVPKIEEYKKATEGIKLTSFIPSSAKPLTFG